MSLYVYTYIIIYICVCTHVAIDFQSMVKAPNRSSITGPAMPRHKGPSPDHLGDWCPGPVQRREALGNGALRHRAEVGFLKQLHLVSRLGEDRVG